MTSELTREQLIKKAQEQIEFCRHTKITGEGRAHVNQCAALFEIALAALDSEPAMFCSEETLAAARDGEHLLRTLSSPSGECVIPLYRHAQPAPDNRQVDELTMWIKRLVRSLKNANPDSKLPRDAMDYLTAKGLISVGDILR